MNDEEKSFCDTQIDLLSMHLVKNIFVIVKPLKSKYFNFYNNSKKLYPKYSVLAKALSVLPRNCSIAAGRVGT